MRDSGLDAGAQHTLSAMVGNNGDGTATDTTVGTEEVVSLFHSGGYGATIKLPAPPKKRVSGSFARIDVSKRLFSGV